MGRNCTPFRSHSIRRSTHDEPCRPTRFFFSFSPLKPTHINKIQLAEKKSSSPHPYYSPLFIYLMYQEIWSPHQLLLLFTKKSLFINLVFFLIFCVIDVLILIPSKFIYFIRLFGRHAPYIIFKNNNINSIDILSFTIYLESFELKLLFINKLY